MKTPKNNINNLPELPLEFLELSGKLKPARNAPVLTILPKKLRPPKPPVKPLIPNKSQHFYRKYFVLVIYPVVVGYGMPTQEGGLVSPDEHWNPPEAKLPVGRDTLRSNNAEKCIERFDIGADRQERFYKLTKYKGKTLKNPMFCTVHGGPWVATVYEEQSCFDGITNKWILVFTVLGNEVSLTWYGNFEDIPSFPNLNVLMGTLVLHEETWSCCPGYKWCPSTNSCIPQSLDCPDEDPL